MDSKWRITITIAARPHLVTIFTLLHPGLPAWTQPQRQARPSLSKRATSLPARPRIPPCHLQGVALLAITGKAFTEARHRTQGRDWRSALSRPGCARSSPSNRYTGKASCHMPADQRHAAAQFCTKGLLPSGPLCSGISAAESKLVNFLHRDSHILVVL